MKSVFLSFGLLLATTPAFADGFVCQSLDGAINAKVYNNTAPQAGTRTAAVLVLSDTAVNAGNKTIARFTDANGTLDNESATYVANVDHRFNDSGRTGELIEGTKIGNLKTIKLKIAFSYAIPLANGSHVYGLLSLVRRNGGPNVLVQMDCARYLKN